MRSGLLVEESGAGARVSLRPRARPPRGRRPAVGGHGRRRPTCSSPGRWRRAARAATAARGSRRSRTTTRRRAPSAASSARSSTTCWPPSRPPARSRSRRPAARYRTALELGIDDPRERADALLGLGDARTGRGDAEEAIAGLPARRPSSRASSATPSCSPGPRSSYEEACWRPAIHDAGAAELLEEAVAALGADDSELRARALGGLARALDLRGDPDPGRAGARRVDRDVAPTRRPAEPRGDARAGVLVAGHEHERGRQRDAPRGASARRGARGRRARGRGALLARAVVRRALRPRRGARPPDGSCSGLVGRTNEPFRLHVAEHYAAALALCDGDLAAAESAAIRSREWGRLLTGRDASGTYGIQMFGIRREQGRLAELAPVVRLLDAGVARRRLAARPHRRLRRARDGRRRPPRAAPRARRRARAAPLVALDRVARLPGRRLRGARRSRGRGGRSIRSSRRTRAAT